MPTSNTLQARLMDLITPLILLFTSLACLPLVLLSNPFLLLRPSSLQSAWFAKLWAKIGPQMALSPEQTPYISSLMSRARGTVLELGPGSGDQMRHFATVVQQEGVFSSSSSPGGGEVARLVGELKGEGFVLEVHAGV